MKFHEFITALKNILLDEVAVWWPTQMKLSPLSVSNNEPSTFYYRKRALDYGYTQTKGKYCRYES